MKTNDPLSASASGILRCFRGAILALVLLLGGGTKFISAGFEVYAGDSRGIVTHASLPAEVSVDTTSEEEVRNFHNAVFRAPEGIPMEWTGSIPGCDLGKVSDAYLEAPLNRIEDFRAMTGVPADINPRLHRKAHLMDWYRLKSDLLLV